MCEADAVQLVLAVGARLPRIFTGLLVGAALGIAGCLTRTLAGNRLATPDMVGVNEGAAAVGSPPAWSATGGWARSEPWPPPSSSSCEREERGAPDTGCW